MSYQAWRFAGEDWRRLFQIAKRAVENDELMRSREESQFVEQMHERLLAWREQAFVSPGQKRWLERIGKRLDRALAGTEGLVPVDEAIRETRP